MIKCIDRNTKEEVTVYRLRKGYEVFREKGEREFYKFEDFIKLFEKPKKDSKNCSACEHPCH